MKPIRQRLVHRKIHLRRGGCSDSRKYFTLANKSWFTVYFIEMILYWNNMYIFLKYLYDKLWWFVCLNLRINKFTPLTFEFINYILTVFKIALISNVNIIHCCLFYTVDVNFIWIVTDRSKINLQMYGICYFIYLSGKNDML